MFYIYLFYVSMLFFGTLMMLFIFIFHTEHLVQGGWLANQGIEGRGSEREEERGESTTIPQDIRGWAPLAPEGTQGWGREEIESSISSLSSSFSCDIAVTSVT